MAGASSTHFYITSSHLKHHEIDLQSGEFKSFLPNEARKVIVGPEQMEQWPSNTQARWVASLVSCLCMDRLALGFLWANPTSVTMVVVRQVVVFFYLSI